MSRGATVSLSRPVEEGPEGDEESEAVDLKDQLPEGQEGNTSV